MWKWLVFVGLIVVFVMRFAVIIIHVKLRLLSAFSRKCYFKGDPLINVVGRTKLRLHFSKSMWIVTILYMFDYKSYCYLILYYFSI